LGAACLLRLSGALAAGGLLLALIVKEPVIAIAGFGLVGLGVANLIPVIFSAAGRAYAVAPGHGLAAVATTGYVGFLAGPPAIGLAAEVAGLPAALGIVALACAAVALAAPHRVLRADGDLPARPGRGRPAPLRPRVVAVIGLLHGRPRDEPARQSRRPGVPHPALADPARPGKRAPVSDGGSRLRRRR